VCVRVYVCVRAHVCVCVSRCACMRACVRACMQAFDLCVCVCKKERESILLISGGDYRMQWYKISSSCTASTCCSVLYCVAACCNVLQCAAVHLNMK